MSAGATVGPNITSATPSNDRIDRSTNLRLWPAVVLLVVFWAFLFVNHYADMSMGARFLSRMAAYAIFLLTFLGWWLSRSAFSWRERLLAIATVVVILIAAERVSDKSMNMFALVLLSIPWVFTVWVLWLWVAKSFTSRVKYLGFLISVMLPIAFFALLRWDGLDALQQAELSWRWVPTKEASFLSTHRDIGKLPAANSAGAKPWTPQPGDCLEYRGAHRDGIISNLKIDPNWKEHPPKLLWSEKIGPGWSDLIVVDGHVITQEQRGDSEAVVCYDAATGQEIWAHLDPVRFEEGLSGAGPRSTPTFADGHIYAFGGKGILNCLSAANGNIEWSHDVAKDAEVAPAEIPQWGYSVSPLVVDRFVVVFPGGSKDKSIVAYSTIDGKLAWARAAGKQSYSSPQLVTLNDQRQIVMHDTEALRGINVADGAMLWELPNEGAMALPMLQPHLAGPNSLVTSCNSITSLTEVGRDGDKLKATAKWTANSFRPDFSDFVLHKGCLYGLNDGILCCYDLSDGKKLWKKGRLGHGQLLALADQDMLIVSSEKGELILVSVNREGYEELGRVQAIEGKTWNGPVLAAGKLFLRNGEEMAAYEVNLQK